MASVVQVTERIVTQQCINCGVWFGVPEFFDTRRQQDGKNFYCPSGHSQCYRESDADRLRKQLNREIASHDQTRAHRDDAERRVTAQKGVNTKLKKRVGNGVCPCCNRSFTNLRRHMKCKHPDFAEASPGEG